MTKNKYYPKKYPKGFYTLCFIEMWERLSHYGMRSILILYLSKSIFEGGLNIPTGKAVLIYGYFAGFINFSPTIGGWLADKYLGNKNSINLGGIFMAIGQFILFAINNQLGLYLGMFLFVLGTGFFKPSIYTMVGKLYTRNDLRKDSAFSIFYMFTSIGAILGPLIIGYVAEDAFSIKKSDGEILSFGYRYGFLITGACIILGQMTFSVLYKKHLVAIDVKADKFGKNNTTIAKEPLTKKEIDRIWAIIFLTAISTFFWSGFEQTGSSLFLYTENFIDRQISIGIYKWIIPTSWFQTINPLFIIGLAPVLAFFWQLPYGKKISTPVKMGIAMILLGLGFVFTLGAIAERGGDLRDTNIKASLIWIVLVYFFHTLGELCLSPIGLSMVTKLSPPNLNSFMMGVWLLSSSLANFAGGYIAMYIENIGAKGIFTVIALVSIFLGVLVIRYSGLLSKKMHGVN